MMRELTPLVEPLSLDEAYLDLSGTERLHRRPARPVAGAAGPRIEARIGITVSIGLACNKFLAKLASELDKPRGFAVIGMAEAVASCATSRSASSAAPARRCRRGWRGRHHHDRPAAGRRTTRAGEALRRHRPVAAPARPRAGRRAPSIPTAR